MLSRTDFIFGQLKHKKSLQYTVKDNQIFVDIAALLQINDI